MYKSKIPQFDKLTSLSVFFPCYNEENNLPVLLEKALEVVPGVAEKYEIIVVNDGSTDKTREVAEKYAREYPQIRVVNQANQGYGGAVNTGFKSSKYNWIFFTDSDLQFDLEDLYRFVQEASTENVELVIGYRKNRAEGPWRAFLAKGMKFLNALTLGFPLYIRDIDCAFKLIRKDVISYVGELESRGNLVSTEFLMKAISGGYRVKQLGVNHMNRKYGESKCGGLDDVLLVLKEISVLRGRINSFEVSKKHALSQGSILTRLGGVISR